MEKYNSQYIRINVVRSSPSGAPLNIDLVKNIARNMSALGLLLMLEVWILDVVIQHYCCEKITHQWPLLLTWLNFNPSKDK